MENAACVNRRKVIPERERKMYGDIIILSGAGISAESGIPTFRDSDGLWNNHRIEEVATIEAYRRNPEAVHDFYNNLKTDLQKAEPNPAHLAITRLQNEYKNGTVSVVTQNVDLLHEKAGNRNVYHIHGQIDQAVCMNCGRVITTWGEVTTETVCPGCGDDEAEHCLFRRKPAPDERSGRFARQVPAADSRGYFRRGLSGQYFCPDCQISRCRYGGTEFAHDRQQL